MADFGARQGVVPLVQGSQGRGLPPAALLGGGSGFALVVPVVIAGNVDPVEPGVRHDGQQGVHRRQGGEIEHVAAQHDQFDRILAGLRERLEQLALAPVADAIVFGADGRAPHPLAVLTIGLAPAVLNREVRVGQEKHPKRLGDAGRLKRHAPLAHDGISRPHVALRVGRGGVPRGQEHKARQNNPF